MANVSTKNTAIDRNTKILRITLALTVISFIIFLITLTSSNWIGIIYNPPDFYAKRQKMFVTRSTYGVIWECLIGKPTNNSMYSTYE